MLDPATGLRRKILIFTEPKDTLEYPKQREMELVDMEM
jgi:hypothetical protein